MGKVVFLFYVEVLNVKPSKEGKMALRYKKTIGWREDKINSTRRVICQKRT